MKVLVVGAGLSGMILATALKRAHAAVDIIELHPAWQVLGVGISVQGPALRALKALGLLEPCIAAGFGYSQVVNCDQNGNVQAVVELPRLNGPQYPACVGMMRPALHEVVAARCTRPAWPCASALRCVR
jgi:2-polyprenyl-6-methoxyphenol hydroxylase-like FAD-dependent oxidoreductase